MRAALVAMLCALPAAAQLSSKSHFGLAFQLDNGIVLRVFRDDRVRLKLLCGAGIQFFFDLPVGGLSAWLGAGFETVL